MMLFRGEKEVVISKLVLMSMINKVIKEIIIIIIIIEVDIRKNEIGIIQM